MVLTGLFLLTAKTLYAQQLPQYSQYMMNKFLINPAVAGSEGYTSFNLTAREQWIGLQHGVGKHFAVEGKVNMGSTEASSNWSFDLKVKRDFK